MLLPCTLSFDERTGGTMGISCHALEPRRLFTAGMHDPTFAGDGTAEFSGDLIELLATTPDHHILAVVRTGDNTATLWRLTRQGLVDTTFGGGDGNVELPDTTFFESYRAIAVNSADGQFAISDSARVRVFNADGSSALTIDSPATCVVVTPSGEFLVGDSGHITAYQSDGSVDTDFAVAGTITLAPPLQEIKAIRIQSDGKIVVAANGQRMETHTDVDGPFDIFYYYFNAVRFTSTGLLDPTFPADGRVAGTADIDLELYGQDMIIEDDGSIVMLEAEGDYSAVDTGFKTGIFRMPSNGLQTDDTRPQAVSTHLAKFATLWPKQIHVLPDGRFVMGSESGVFRFLPSFKQDSSFGINGGGDTRIDQLRDVLIVQSDGSVIVAGVTDGHAVLQRLQSDLEPGSFITDDSGKLRVRGTDGDDEILLRQGTVRLNGLDTGAFDPATVTSVEIDGGEGDDVIIGGNWPAYVLGGAGNDRISWAGADSTLSGGGGNDAIDGGNAREVMNGGPGDDTLRSGAGRDFIRGGAGRDYLDGGPQRDIIRGDGGRDILFGHGGNDHLDGGPGDDRLYGGPGADHLFGGRGNDHLHAGLASADIDTLVGSAGDDDALKDVLDIVQSVETLLA
jgi:Ca2+-binding RTX toxin-like protein